MDLYKDYKDYCPVYIVILSHKVSISACFRRLLYQVPTSSLKVISL